MIIMIMNNNIIIVVIILLMLNLCSLFECHNLVGAHYLTGGIPNMGLYLIPSDKNKANWSAHLPNV